MNPDKAATRFSLPFYLSLLTTLLLFFGHHALMPTLPLYVLYLGGTAASNGLVQWVFALAAVLMRPVSGALADRWGDWPVLVVGALLFGSGPLLYALCPSLGMLLLARAFHGTGMAFYTTAYRALATALTPAGRRGEGLGVIGTATSVTMLVAPLLGEWAAARWGFAALFVLLSGLGLLAVLSTLLLPRHSRPCAEQSWASLRAALGQFEIRRCVVIMLLLGVPFSAWVGFLSLLAQARAISTTGWAYTAYAALITAGGLLAGRLADRWGRRRVALPSMGLIALAALGLALTHSPWGLVALGGLLGLAWGAARTALDTLAQDAVPSSLRGSAAAAQYTAFDLGIGLASLGLGLLADWGDYVLVFGAGAVATLAAMPLLGWRRRPAPGGESTWPCS